jgi:NTE family protein
MPQVENPWCVNWTYILEKSPLFEGVSASLLAECAPDAREEYFARGKILTQQGTTSDRFYIIVTGTAEVELEKEDGSEEFVATLGEGDFFGDLGILLNQPRTVTVRAARNCSALSFSKEEFLRLHSSSHPFALKIARTLAGRLQRTTRTRLSVRRVTDVAIIKLSTADVVSQLAQEVADAIGRTGRELKIHRADLGRSIEIDGFLAESDVVILLADAVAPPKRAILDAMVDRIRSYRPQPLPFLLFCHQKDSHQKEADTEIPPEIDRCAHVRVGDALTVARVARLVSGCATGLALSGGGARGFAHIGVIKALEDAAIPVDFICGTSMGAIVAALYASGFNIERITAEMKRGYVDESGFPDFAIPRVAIYSGRATDRKLKAMFGDLDIEDLPIPYFAVAADLRSAQAIILERGRVWQAARISCSIPGILPPTKDGARLLVDGALLDNLPVSALRQRCGGRVIASDVSVTEEFFGFGQVESERLPGIGQIMMRASQLASVRDSRDSGFEADLYLNPDLSDVGMTDFRRIDELIERGRQFARRHLEERWHNGSK